MGKGVTKAVDNINTIINDTLVGLDASDIYAVDAAIIKADGTKDKSKLGANAILAASIACCKAASIALDIPLYHSERVAKYNQLLRIEEELGDSAVYPGIKAFNVH